MSGLGGRSTSLLGAQLGLSSYTPPPKKLPGAGLFVGECHLPPPAPLQMGEAPKRDPCLALFPGSAERPFPHLRVSLRGLEHVQSALAGRLLWRAQPGQSLAEASRPCQPLASGDPGGRPAPLGLGRCFLPAALVIADSPGAPPPHLSPSAGRSEAAAPGKRVSGRVSGKRISVAPVGSPVGGAAGEEAPSRWPARWASEAASRWDSPGRKSRTRSPAGRPGASAVVY